MINIFISLMLTCLTLLQSHFSQAETEGFPSTAYNKCSDLKATLAIFGEVRPTSHTITLSEAGNSGFKDLSKDMAKDHLRRNLIRLQEWLVGYLSAIYDYKLADLYNRNSDLPALLVQARESCLKNPNLGFDEVVRLIVNSKNN